HRALEPDADRRDPLVEEPSSARVGALSAHRAPVAQHLLILADGEVSRPQNKTEGPRGLRILGAAIGAGGGRSVRRGAASRAREDLEPGKRVSSHTSRAAQT